MWPSLLTREHRECVPTSRGAVGRARHVLLDFDGVMFDVRSLWVPRPVSRPLPTC